MVYDTNGPTYNNFIANPAVARLNSSVSISFIASKTLGGIPAVTINGRPATLVNHISSFYNYSFQTKATDPDGPCTINISGKDPLGNIGISDVTNALHIDNAIPESQAMTGTINPNSSFTIKWAANDKPVNNYASGIKTVNVYMRLNAGPFQLLGQYPGSTTNMTFNPPYYRGYTYYGFCTVATDLGGNTEALPTDPDCMIIVDDVHFNGIAHWFDYQ